MPPLSLQRSPNATFSRVETCMLASIISGRRSRTHEGVYEIASCGHYGGGKGEREAETTASTCSVMGGRGRQTSRG